MSTTVLVSGASGFIAQHVVKALLDKNYNVVGTVRSAAKGDNLVELFADKKFSYEIVADIGAEGAFDQALKNHPEVTVFLHTASPFHFQVTDIEKELLLPAINGTKNALSSIKKYGPQVTNVVVTSSYAAMFTFSREGDNTLVNSEESWNPVTWEESLANPLIGYCASKAFAEKAAWEFLEKEKPNFKLTTVNPSYVFGPQAFASSIGDLINTSSEILYSFLKLKAGDDVPEHMGKFADVRDVADAHLVAFEKPEAAGQRLLLSSESFVTQSILNILNEEFPSLRGKIPVGAPETVEEQLVSSSKIDNEKTRDLIGKPLIGLRESVVDSIEQILSVKKNLHD
ncbi:methylglyoxal reductase (NADPH-dependent) gre2 [Scheffersomyces spartinae]|uniref:Methylglyoxal reductase (NADPH-dependent) gre2 n=1 Tax=Scheffersomyces spartinae TaxID=45513 RepID=A0A9P7VBR4_9ASCO|nr:methylglyoxal reductase (NADPH-dependent) gre2 [Scheffersomyces spartinae]KAG7194962.1 methylglyoxal reductase (NADPH-dependent) gre2 [Scheffersomyces spartinae]